MRLQLCTHPARSSIPALCYRMVHTLCSGNPGCRRACSPPPHRSVASASVTGSQRFRIAIKPAEEAAATPRGDSVSLRNAVQVGARALGASWGLGEGLVVAWGRLWSI